MQRWALVLVSIAIALAGVGCSSSAPGSARLKVGMMPKLMGIGYFNACEKGAKEAAAELGIELTFDGPPTDSVELQAQIVDKWIAMGYDVIGVAANDPERLAPALKRARDAGIAVFTFDADANAKTSGRMAFCNQASVVDIGNLLVDLMAEAIGGKGKTVIVSSTVTAPNQNEWMKVMNQRLAEKYPQIVLLPTLYPEENRGKAREMTRDLLDAHPDLAGVWGITSVALPGAAEAVRQAGKTGKVFVTGLSLPSEMRSYVKDGTVPQFVLWSPVDLGYLGIHVGLRLKEGPMPSGTYDFGRLKNVKVSEGEVLLGPPMIFDKDNVDAFDF
jgi:ABC-type sugar transport system substrate-binding protein